MDFIKRLEEARALGLTKDEFLAIYMQEMEIKMAMMSNNKLGDESNAACSTEMQQHQSSQHPGQQQFQQKQHRFEQQQQCCSQHHQQQQHYLHQQQQQYHQQQQQHQQQAQSMDISHHKMKAWLEALQEVLLSQYRGLRDDNATTKEDLNNAQREIHSMLRGIEEKIRTLKQERQDHDLEKAFTTLHDKLQILRSQIEIECEDVSKNTRQYLTNFTSEILGEFSRQAQLEDGRQSLRFQRQDELLKQQSVMIKELVGTLFQQQQQQHFGMLQSIQGVEVRLLSKLNELCNGVSVQLLQYEHNHQVARHGLANLDKQVRENSCLLQAMRAEYSNLQNKIDQGHNKILSSIETFNNWDNVGEDEWYGFEEFTEDVKYLHGQMITLTSTENDKNDEELDVFRDIGQDTLSRQSQESTTLVCTNFQASSATLIYNFYLKHLSLMVDSGKEIQGIIFSKQLGCCLRSNVHFPRGPGGQNVLDISFDMCKLGEDVRLPNLLRISTETSLVDQFGSSRDWVVAREFGVFNLSKCQKKGWFEASFISLDYESLLQAGYVKDDAILVRQFVTVLNRNAWDEPDNLMAFTDRDIKSDSSEDDDDVDEFFDADDHEDSPSDNALAEEKGTEDHRPLIHGEGEDRDKEVPGVEITSVYHEDQKYTGSLHTKRDIDDGISPLQYTSKLETILAMFDTEMDREKQILPLPVEVKLNKVESEPGKYFSSFVLTEQQYQREKTINKSIQPSLQEEEEDLKVENSNQDSSMVLHKESKSLSKEATGIVVDESEHTRQFQFHEKNSDEESLVVHKERKSIDIVAAEHIKDDPGNTKQFPSAETYLDEKGLMSFNEEGDTQDTVTSEQATGHKDMKNITCEENNSNNHLLQKELENSNMVTMEEAKELEGNTKQFHYAENYSKEDSLLLLRQKNKDIETEFAKQVTENEEVTQLSFEENYSNDHMPHGENKNLDTRATYQIIEDTEDMKQTHCEDNYSSTYQSMSKNDENETFAKGAAEQVAKNRYMEHNFIPHDVKASKGNECMLFHEENKGTELMTTEPVTPNETVLWPPRRVKKHSNKISFRFHKKNKSTDIIASDQGTAKSEDTRQLLCTNEKSKEDKSMLLPEKSKNPVTEYLDLKATASSMVSPGKIKSQLTKATDQFLWDSEDMRQTPCTESHSNEECSMLPYVEYKNFHTVTTDKAREQEEDMKQIVYKGDDSNKHDRPTSILPHEDNKIPDTQAAEQITEETQNIKQHSYEENYSDDDSLIFEVERKIVDKVATEQALDQKEDVTQHANEERDSHRDSSLLLQEVHKNRSATKQIVEKAGLKQLLNEERDSDEGSLMFFHEERKSLDTVVPEHVMDQKREVDMKGLPYEGKGSNENNSILLHEEYQKHPIFTTGQAKELQEDMKHASVEEDDPSKENALRLLNEETKNVGSDTSPWFSEKAGIEQMSFAGGISSKDSRVLFHEENKYFDTVATEQMPDSTLKRFPYEEKYLCEDNLMLFHEVNKNLNREREDPEPIEDGEEGRKLITLKENENIFSLNAGKDTDENILSELLEDPGHSSTFTEELEDTNDESSFFMDEFLTLVRAEYSKDKEVVPLHEMEKSFSATQTVKEKIPLLLSDSRDHLPFQAAVEDTAETPALSTEEKSFPEKELESGSSHLSQENKTPASGAESDIDDDISALIEAEKRLEQLLIKYGAEEETPVYLIPDITHYFRIQNLNNLIGSQILIDSEEWYIQFLGQSVRAVLVFIEPNTFTVCLDYFHGNCDDNLPECAIFKCRVQVVDPTNRMEDKVLGEWVGLFDMARETPPDWPENNICSVDCDSLAQERYLLHDEILLKFDFFEM